MWYNILGKLFPSYVKFKITLQKYTMKLITVQ